nr:immunoglobulin heavy chain junction region [Mus musculus]MBK4188305.1 immunoglobulin heavy chain junction region [Mus musculus]MBK4188307.1 immunoglobulin heavy chain junction region [Mus musculus]
CARPYDYDEVAWFAYW